MINIKKVLLISLIALSLLACKPNTQESMNNSVNFHISNYQHENGVECIFYQSGNAAGLSCNWGKYNKFIDRQIR
jgi:hypothetical protein